jgi:hypothetical protein
VNCPPSSPPNHSPSPRPHLFQFSALPLQLRLELRPVGVQLGMTVGHGLQFIEHGGHIPRHADLIGLCVVGLGSTPWPPI